MKRLIFLFALAAALCFGQALGDFPWWDSPIAQNLNLTPEQQKQIRGTVREFRDRMAIEHPDPHDGLDSVTWMREERERRTDQIERAVREAGLDRGPAR